MVLLNKRVSVAIFSYNQERFIEEAVLSVLAQECEPIQIIISDDCSTDKTFEIIKHLIEGYRGHHQVVIRQTKKNKGLASHVNEVMSLISGEIIIFCAGDDISHSNRVLTTKKYFDENPKVVEILCSAYVINEYGGLCGERLLSKNVASIQSRVQLIRGKNRTFGAGRAIRREVFSKFGPLNSSCPTEDTPLMIRSALLGLSLMVPDKLISYRVHGHNLSSVDSISKMDVREIYSQYVSDLHIAYQSRLINEDELFDFVRWLRREKHLRKAKSLINQGKKIDFHLLVRLFFDKGLGIKSKGKAFMLFFLGKN